MPINYLTFEVTMKKVYNFLILIIISILLVGCVVNPNRLINEIINKEIDYGKVTVEDLQQLIQETVMKLEDSVIGITFTEGIFPETTSFGSGVIVKRKALLNDDSLGEVDGNIQNYRYYVVTNRHVVMNKKSVAKNLKTYIGKLDLEYDAICLYYDNAVDIALVQFDCPAYFVPVEIGDSTVLKKGSFALAIGNPYSFDYYSSVTFGIISHPLRYLEESVFNSKKSVNNEYIQHDAAINEGNSGGGLFDIYGNLIGINTLKIIGENQEIDNMGFSVPSSKIRLILGEYLK